MQVIPGITMIGTPQVLQNQKSRPVLITAFDAEKIPPRGRPSIVTLVFREEATE